MKNFIRYIVLIVLMLVLITTEAQTFEEAIGFEDSLSDGSPAPIHFLIPVAIAIGVAIGIKKLK